jgi:hypothetical protein
VKTTIELPESMLLEAKALARAKRSSLRQILIDGLRIALERERQPAKPFALRDGSRPIGFPELRWEEMRRLIYEGHGE